MQKRSKNRAAILQNALQAARDIRRDEFVALLAGVQLQIDAVAPLEEIWLAGEYAFVYADFPRAAQLFEQFEEDPRSEKAPPWQRYVSSHRRTLAYYRQGFNHRAFEAFAEAEDRLKEVPEFAHKAADLEAMRGHFLELRDDFEGALERFRRAHRMAFRSQHWATAASAAADLGRIYGLLRDRKRALAWLHRAQAVIQRHPRSYVDRVIAFRRGRVLEAFGDVAAALALYDRVINESGDDLTPEAVVEALWSRSALRARSQDYDGAETDLRNALSICQRKGCRVQEVEIRAEFEWVRLARCDATHTLHTPTEFPKALALTLESKPPEPRLLLRLGSDLLKEPRLIGRTTLSLNQRRALERLLRDLNTLKVPATPARFGDHRLWQRALVALTSLLASLVKETQRETIQLARATIVDGWLQSAHGGRAIPPSLLEVLKVLLHAPPRGITPAELAQDRGLSIPAANKRLSRLGELLLEDLRCIRTGNIRRYSLRRSQKPSAMSL